VQNTNEIRLNKYRQECRSKSET